MTRLPSGSLTLLKLSPRRSVICHSADFYRNEAPRRLLARKGVDSTFNDGAGNIWLYVYPVEGGVFATADPNFQNAIAPACQTGNWIAFFVTDATTGAWSQVFTYTFK